MASDVEGRGERLEIPWRLIGWGTAALLLLLPLIAGAPWTLSDFVLAGLLLAGAGLAFEFIMRKSVGRAYRLGAALAVLAAVLTVWINGAAGMIGDEDNPYNLLFLGVLLVALVGAILARLRPEGMARAMVVTGMAQVAVGVGGLSTDLRGSVLSAVFAGLWLIAAALFRNAAREPQQLAE